MSDTTTNADKYPEPLSDPEAEGLPAYADDDSFADPEAPTSRVADGPAPTALPADRPQAATDFGTTPREMREGEPLADRLRREEPADPDGAPSTGPGATPEGSPRDDWLRTPDVVDSVDRIDQIDEIGEIGGVEEIDEEPPPAPDSETAATLEGLDPHRDSPVSVLDRDREGEVGRLVEPDEGARADTEKDAVASDRGTAGGGASAEERALHEVRGV